MNFEFVVRPTVGGEITSTVNASALQDDPDQRTNSGSIIVTVAAAQPLVDLRPMILTSANPTLLGQPFQYIVEVVNGGTIDAQQAFVRVLLPIPGGPGLPFDFASFSYDSISTSQGTFQATFGTDVVTLDCELGAISAGSSATIVANAFPARQGDPAAFGDFSGFVLVQEARDLAPGVTSTNNQATFRGPVVIANPADGDDDGVPDAVENAAPNGGDNNFDGVPDGEQDRVASLPNAVDGRYVTLINGDPLVPVVPRAQFLRAVRALPPPAPADAPAGVSFPLGILKFVIDPVINAAGAPEENAGGPAGIVLLLPPGVTIDSYYKHGPTPSDLIPHWYDFSLGIPGPDFLTGASTVEGVYPGTGLPFIQLFFADNRRGDHFLAIDNIISDPGGPAQLADPADTTGPTILNLSRFGVHRQPTRLALTFNEALDPSSATDTTRYALFAPGRDRRLGTGDDRRIAVTSAAYDASSRTVTITPRSRLPLRRRFLLVIEDGPNAITDLAGNAFDGDLDGRTGGSFAATVDRHSLVRVGPARANTRRLPVNDHSSHLSIRPLIEFESYHYAHSMSSLTNGGLPASVALRFRRRAARDRRP
jgi:hypothetical protein